LQDTKLIYVIGDVQVDKQWHKPQMYPDAAREGVSKGGLSGGSVSRVKHKRKLIKAHKQAPGVSGTHKRAGKASWYCSSEIPICHYKYPPGSMVAAACGKLRTAMGPGWRGKRVSVRATNGRRVVVTLVDWCGSKTKLIDLYREPMRLLGGSGVLDVVVRW
jgi:hypothetical protein